MNCPISDVHLSWPLLLKGESINQWQRTYFACRRLQIKYLASTGRAGDEILRAVAGGCR